MWGGGSGWVDKTFLPPFSDVVRALVHLAHTGELWTDLRASPTRSLAGYALTIVAGIGETSKIAIIIAYASFWPLVYNTISGAKNVDPLLIRSARSFGVNNLTLFRKVILPSAVPTIFTGARLAGATAIVVLITTELVGAKAGPGYLISNSEYNFQIPQMYAGIVTVSLIGLVFNFLLVFLERRFSRWKTHA